MKTNLLTKAIIFFLPAFLVLAMLFTMVFTLTDIERLEKKTASTQNLIESISIILADPELIEKNNIDATTSLFSDNFINGLSTFTVSYYSYSMFLITPDGEKVDILQKLTELTEQQEELERESGKSEQVTIGNYTLTSREQTPQLSFISHGNAAGNYTLYLVETTTFLNNYDEDSQNTIFPKEIIEKSGEYLNEKKTAQDIMLNSVGSEPILKVYNYSKDVTLLEISFTLENLTDSVSLSPPLTSYGYNKTIMSLNFGRASYE